MCAQRLVHRFDRRLPTGPGLEGLDALEQQHPGAVDRLRARGRRVPEEPSLEGRVHRVERHQVGVPGVGGGDRLLGLQPDAGGVGDDVSLGHQVGEGVESVAGRAGNVLGEVVGARGGPVRDCHLGTGLLEPERERAGGSSGADDDGARALEVDVVMFERPHRAREVVVVAPDALAEVDRVDRADPFGPVIGLGKREGVTLEREGDGQPGDAQGLRAAEGLLDPVGVGLEGDESGIDPQLVEGGLVHRRRQRVGDGVSDDSVNVHGCAVSQTGIQNGFGACEAHIPARIPETSTLMSQSLTRSGMVEQRSLEELVPTVADYTLELDFEEFIQGERPMVLRGLLATDDDEHTEIAERYVDRAVRSQSSAGQMAYGSIDVVPEWDEHRIFRPVPDAGAVAYLALEVYENDGPEFYLDACRRQFESFHEEALRTTEGGLSHHTEEIELWIDAVYMMCPFMARYGQLADRPEAIDEAVDQILVHDDRLRDLHTDLYRHIWRETPNSYPDGSLWLRGNGWLATGVLDTLRYVPDDHPERDRLEELLVDHLESMAEYQDRSGFWHHLIDDPSMYLETSGTLQYAFAFVEAVERGLLDDDYLETAERAIGAAKTVVTDDGAVQRNAAMPGGPEAPQAVNLYGQGWFLITGTRLLESEIDA